MIWYTHYITEKDENSNFPNSYKMVIKRPHPIPGFLYRIYYAATEMVGFRECEGCGWVRKHEMYSSEYCQSCHEHRFCECGQRLEDAYGSPGDGFCIRCR